MQVRQGIVGLAGGLNVLFGVQGDVAQLLDLVDHRLGLLLVRIGGRQLGVGRLGIGELLEIGDQGLLVLVQRIIGAASRVNGCLALGRDGGNDLIDQLDHRVGLELVPFPGGLLKDGKLCDIALLGCGQTVVAVPGGGDGRAAVGGDGSDLADQIVHLLGLGLIVGQLQLVVFLLGGGEGGIVRNPRLLLTGQGIIGLSGRVNFRLAGIGIADGANAVDQRNDIFCVLDGLTVLAATLFVIIVIGIVQDDYIPIADIPAETPTFGCVPLTVYIQPEFWPLSNSPRPLTARI